MQNHVPPQAISFTIPWHLFSRKKNVIFLTTFSNNLIEVTRESQHGTHLRVAKKAYRLICFFCIGFCNGAFLLARD